MATCEADGMSLPDETVPKGSEKEGRLGKKEKPSKMPSKEMRPLARPEESQLKLVAASELLSLKEQLKQEQEKSNEYLNKLLYAQADFENYRRRLDQEVESRIESGKARLIQRLLTIVDELELALNAAKNSEGAEAVADGLEIVLRKFRDLLTTEGLAPIEALGKKFDPALHEAVQRIERGDTDEGTILEEVRKGFTLKGKLIRPSIVKIAVPLIAESDKSAEGE
jgi:molecular chaperone GrpE